MNVNLGAPYESLMERLIERGYAGNQTELIRQALMAYDRQIEEEEVALVHKGVQLELAEMKSKGVKPATLEEMKRKYRL